MKNSVYPERCFSSQCGLCSSCTDAMHPTPTQKGTPELDRPEIDYSKVVEKFEKSRIYNATEQYMNRMYQLHIRELRDDFKNGSEQDYGIIPNRYIADEYHSQPSVYIKQPTGHSLVCDMPLCKAMYHSLPEYTQKSKYPKFPIYVRNIRDKVLHDEPCALCYECISKCGEARK
jgi:hypothetical protein